MRRYLLPYLGMVASFLVCVGSCGWAISYYSGFSELPARVSQRLVDSFSDEKEGVESVLQIPHARHEFRQMCLELVGVGAAFSLISQQRVGR